MAKRSKTACDKTVFRDMRIALGLTVGTCADILGVTPRTLVNWENETDSRYPHPTACRALSWMIDGFRPPQFKTRSNIGRKPKGHANGE